MCDSSSKIRAASNKIYELTKDATTRISCLDDCIGKVAGSESEIKIGTIVAEEMTRELELIYRDGKKLIKKLEAELQKLKETPEEG